MKKGFTLAEVLMTLGIIGVVAALTTPALIQNVGNSKVVPRLQKAKATWETAAELLLNEQGQSSISSVASDSADLGLKMSSHMKITRLAETDRDNFDYKTYDGDTISGANIETAQYFGSRFDSDDGVIYYITLGAPAEPHGYANVPNNQLTGTVMVDTNGAQEPNTIGKDTFLFELYNDGTLRPYGGRGTMRSVQSAPRWNASNHEMTCNSDKVTKGYGCTGSIFDNGMKIIYQ